MKSQDRVFSGKRKAAYKKMQKLGFDLAKDFLYDLEYLFGGDKESEEVRKAASNCAIGAPGVIMPEIHGPRRRKHRSGSRCRKWRLE